MVHPRRISTQRQTISAWVSNTVTRLWYGEDTMMPSHMHPLIAARIKRTASFEWVPMPRHQRMYCN